MSSSTDSAHQSSEDLESEVPGDLDTPRVETQRRMLGGRDFDSRLRTENTDRVYFQNNALGKVFPSEHIAREYLEQRRYQEAMQLYKEILEDRRDRLGDGNLYTIETMSKLAECYSGLLKFSEAIQLNQQALEGQRRILGEGHPDSLRSVQELVKIYTLFGNYSDALRLEEQALQVRRRILGESHRDTIKSAENVARLKLLREINC